MARMTGSVSDALRTASSSRSTACRYSSLPRAETPFRRIEAWAALSGTVRRKVMAPACVTTTSRRRGSGGTAHFPTLPARAGAGAARAARAPRPRLFGQARHEVLDRSLVAGDAGDGHDRPQVRLQAGRFDGLDQAPFQGARLGPRSGQARRIGRGRQGGAPAPVDPAPPP